MKKQSGITLISLVITIIVLLILAGVSINAVVGNNGILANAQKAVKNTEKANLEEIIGMYDLSKHMGENKDFKAFLIESNIITADEIATNEIVKLNGSDAHLGISTQRGLEIISEEVANGNDYSGVTIYLLNDIEFNNEIDFENGTLINGSEFNPIGKSNSAEVKFNGIFDGRNHKIKNVYIRSTESSVGFFGVIGEKGIVKNLTISDLYVTGYSQIGIIAGTNRGTISNCINYSNIVSNTSEIGGIAGRNIGGIIENCINYGSIVSSASQTGGIVGKNCATISNCINYGKIVSSAAHTGGIAGNCDFAENQTITNCENYGDITSASDSVGGIVGYNRYNFIKDCINYGSIVGNHAVGGIAGTAIPLDGTLYIVENCKNKGNVSGNVMRIGGICGHLSGGIVSKCSNVGKIELIGENAHYGVAGIVGSSASNIMNTRIEYCYNEGAISCDLSSDSSTQCAGIIGNIAMSDDGSTICEVISCYNIGDVTLVKKSDLISNTARPAGILGWGKSFRIKNCYNIGTLTGVNSVPRGIIATYQTNKEHTFENNYWLDSCGATYGVGTVNSNEGTEPKTDAEMKALAAILGSDYAQDPNINNGYPYLKVNKP